MLDVGNVIKNRYKITGIIHSSKYSTVYTALDFNLNQEVILKAFTIRVRNPHQIKVAMKKFEKRIIALVSMKHPGIPKFYDYFTKGTQQFLVMEYIPGRNLGKLIEDSFVPVYEPDAVSICIQITDTLNFLHSQSTPVVFKDLKPSHIMVTPDDGIRLIDFGLSHFFKPVGETRKKKVNLHGYAPPEQFAQDVYNEKTDLYPVGVILHQMVTLRDPTDLKNMYKFPPASSINPKITLELDEIIAKATAYRPEIRFGTAGEFHRVLDNHLQRWELLSKRRLIKPRKTEEIEAKLKSTSTEKPEETQDKARETVTIPNAETVKPRSHFKRRSKKKEKKPDKTASDKKSSKPFINNKLLINLTIILILILAILWVLKGYAVKPGQPGNPSEPRSPYALSHDKELAEIRKKGIKLYKKGYNNNDKKVLTEALSYLTKIKYANQADVEVQVYW
ncbi:MAG: serine/threonine protein kinase [Vulcanimicrobiota bacterium]